MTKKLENSEKELDEDEIRVATAISFLQGTIRATHHSQEIRDYARTIGRILRPDAFWDDLRIKVSVD